MLLSGQNFSIFPFPFFCVNVCIQEPQCRQACFSGSAGGSAHLKKQRYALEKTVPADDEQSKSDFDDASSSKFDSEDEVDFEEIDSGDEDLDQVEVTSNDDVRDCVIKLEHWVFENEDGDKLEDDIAILSHGNCQRSPKRHI